MDIIAVYDGALISPVPTYHTETVLNLVGTAIAGHTTGLVAPSVLTTFTDVVLYSDQHYPNVFILVDPNNNLYSTPKPVPPSVGAWGNGYFTFSHLTYDAKQYPESLLVKGTVEWESEVFEFDDGNFVSYVE